MLGFTYNGVHSDTYNIVAKSVDRSLLPTLTKREIEIPGRHGVYDFSENTYQQRYISVDLSYKASSYENIRTQMRSVSSWLSQSEYQSLFFDDEPTIYYLARVYQSLPLSNDKKLARTNVIFECQPFAMYELSVAPVWGDELVWGDDIAWDNTSPSDVVTVTGATTHDLEYDGTQQIGADSPLDSLFNIVISGTFTTLSITMGGNTINYNEAISSEVVTIDNVNMSIDKAGTNKLSVCTGDLTKFFTVVPGTNEVSISGTGLNCEILFNYRKQYL